MAAKPIPPETLQHNYDVWVKHGKVYSHAARDLGIPPNTLRNRIERYEQACNPAATTEPPPSPQVEPGIKGDIDKAKGKGWLELTGYEMPSEDEVLAKYGLDPSCWRVTRVVPNQYQSFYRDKERTSHNVVTLHSLRVYIERAVPEPLEEVAKRLASRITPQPVRKASKAAPREQMAVFGIYDAHIGAYCWAGETDEDNDTDRAVSRVCSAVDEVCEDLSKYPMQKIVMPIGNDFMHYDNARGETTSGRVVTDFDSRYPRVVEACHDALAYMVDRSLDIAREVELVYVGGNHDFMTSYHLTHWLKQRYSRDDRVTVDVSPRKRKYLMWGSVLIGLAHGDGLNLKEVYRHMAEENRENWAKATCREFHFGDKHHRKQIDQKTVDSYGRVTLRQNPSLSPRDKWTYDMGFDSVRCADVWRYDREGFRGMSAAYAR
jgi:hypothetical protein